jgi:hypothetical protein
MTYSMARPLDFVKQEHQGRNMIAVEGAGVKATGLTLSAVADNLGGRPDRLPFGDARR